MKYEIFKKGEWGSDSKPHPRAERRTGEEIPVWDIDITSLADLKALAKEAGPVALGYDGTDDVYYIQIG